MTAIQNANFISMKVFMNQTTTTTTSSYVLLAVVETMLGHLDRTLLNGKRLPTKYTDS